MQSSEGCAVIADCIEQGLIEHGGSDGGTGMLAAGTFLVERALAARRADVQGAALAFLSARLADMDAECVARAARGSRRRRSDAAVPAAQASAVALLGLLDRAAAVACDGDCWQAVASRAEVLVLSGQRAPAIAALDRALEGSLGGHWELWEVRLELASKAAEAAGAAGSRRARQGGAAADAVRRLVAVALERVSAIGRWKLFPQCLSLLFASGDDGSAVFAAVQAALRTPAPASAQAGSVTAEILRAVRCAVLRASGGGGVSAPAGAADIMNTSARGAVMTLTTPYLHCLDCGAPRTHDVTLSQPELPGLTARSGLVVCWLLAALRGGDRRAQWLAAPQDASRTAAC